ncbi:MAG: hypothetical protein KQI35_12010 [Bacteroidetes bacterium]|nr:hypothetical protein [Bacteroidota bacterium]
MKEKIDLLKAIYRPDPNHRGKIRITLDLLSWLWQNRGKFYYFYALGLNKQESRMQDFLYHPEFVKLQKQFDVSYYDPLLEDKFLFDSFLKGLKIPTPPVAGIIENKMILWHGAGEKVPLEAILNRNLDVYCKLVFSWGGKNVFRLQVTNGQLLINGEETTVDDLKLQITGGKYILQETVKQHPELNKLNPWCANTLRVITLSDGIEPGILVAILRVGINKNYVDNASSGNLQSGIGLDNRLAFPGSQWGYPPKYFTHHPDTGVEFKGFEVPYMNEVRQMCIDIHRYLSYFFIISWDIAISEKGPLVIEGNPVPDLMPMQMQSAGFRKMVLEYAERYKKFRASSDPDRKEK